MKKRLSKALASAGVASRRACEEMIFSGKVEVNGEVVLLPQTLVSWEKDEIKVDGKILRGEEKKVYYLLNKPANYICSSKRVGSKKIVLDLFGPNYQRLFTVGRLDRDTTGLLIVTNDGLFAQRIIHPSAGLSKEYLVKVVQEVNQEHLISLSEGMQIERTWVRPLRVVKVRKGTLKISVSEGKKREVRLLIEKAGLTLLSLHRIRIGGLLLGPLPVGAWREMSEKEKKALLQEQETP